MAAGGDRTRLGRRIALVPLALAGCAVVSACTERFISNGCGDVVTCVADGGEPSQASGDGGATDGAGTSTGGNAGVGGESSSSCAEDDVACRAERDEGVFVSSEYGSDATGTGTKGAPFATVSKGIASSGAQRVFVCAGKDAYVEALVVDGAEGVAVYGGFDCDSWAYDRQLRARIVAPTNIALRIHASKNVAFENLQINAADASGSGYDASSYGAFVTDSEQIVFRNLGISAGRGADGPSGEPGRRGEDGAEPGAQQNGSPSNCKAIDPTGRSGGKWPSTPACGGTRGGDGGGSGIATSSPGSTGVPMTNVTPTQLMNAGSGAPLVGQAAENGGDGAYGDTGALAERASRLGSFESGGYLPSHGKTGADGFAGQGGGGGGSSMGTSSCPGDSGGAGGMGGCGGTAGSGGTGGGASVGLLSLTSEVLLDGCELSAADGGAGGGGGGGGAPGRGGVGGKGAGGDVSGGSSAGDGGRGGNGGMGGSGSGGTGGPSYALAFSGVRPLYDEAGTKLVAGKGGAAGRGG